MENNDLENTSWNVYSVIVFFFPPILIFEIPEFDQKYIFVYQMTVL